MLYDVSSERYIELTASTYELIQEMQCQDATNYMITHSKCYSSLRKWTRNGKWSKNDTNTAISVLSKGFHRGLTADLTTTSTSAFNRRLTADLTAHISP